MFWQKLIITNLTALINFYQYQQKVHKRTHIFIFTHIQVYTYIHMYISVYSKD